MFPGFAAVGLFSQSLEVNKKTRSNEADADPVPVSLTVEAVKGDLAPFLPPQLVVEDGQT